MVALSTLLGMFATMFIPVLVFLGAKELRGAKNGRSVLRGCFLIFCAIVIFIILTYEISNAIEFLVDNNYTTN